MSLCIITPNLPPAIDGIGDYCRMFYEHWNQQTIGDLQSELAEITFLLPGQKGKSKVDLTEVRVGNIEPNATGLDSALRDSGSKVVLLQYSGYGYDPNGVPTWLCDGLESWLAENTEHRLFVNFHENWAAGPPWKKVFWLQPAQIQCARRLLNAARAVATSNQAIYKQLRALNSSTAISLIPIGLTLHLPARLPNHNYRRFVALGREGARRRAIRLHLPLLALLQANGLIDELILAGEQASGTDEALLAARRKLNGLKISSAYNFADGAIPESVLSAGVALMHTETACILKSTAFHLAAAAGQVPVAIFNGAPDPPVDCNRHLFTYRPGHMTAVATAFTPDNLQRVHANLAEVQQSTAWPSIVKQWHLLITGGAGRA